MSDFEPVFRDGIGYCSLMKCPMDNVCNHYGKGPCIPWVRSLLEQRCSVREVCRNACSDEMNPDIRRPNFISGQAYCSLSVCPHFRECRCSGEGKPCLDYKPPIPDEKVREAVEWLESHKSLLRPSTAHYIPTLIDAYRELSPEYAYPHFSAEDYRRFGAELQKGTPMSADNVIYVQEQVFDNGTSMWYVWVNAWQSHPKRPTSGYCVVATRALALVAAHDKLKRAVPGHAVQELPAYELPPTKTQAQQDAEFLRTVSCCKQSDVARLDKIAARLEST